MQFLVPKVVYKDPNRIIIKGQAPITKAETETGVKQNESIGKQVTFNSLKANRQPISVLFR